MEECDGAELVKVLEPVENLFDLSPGMNQINKVHCEDGQVRIDKHNWVILKLE